MGAGLRPRSKGREAPPDPEAKAASAQASDRVRERTEVSRGHSSCGDVVKGRTGKDKEEP